MSTPKSRAFGARAPAELGLLAALLLQPGDQAAQVTRAGARQQQLPRALARQRAQHGPHLRGRRQG